MRKKPLIGLYLSLNCEQKIAKNATLRDPELKIRFKNVFALIEAIKQYPENICCHLINKEINQVMHTDIIKS